MGSSFLTRFCTSDSRRFRVGRPYLSGVGKRYKVIISLGDRIGKREISNEECYRDSRGVSGGSLLESAHNSCLFGLGLILSLHPLEGCNVLKLSSGCERSRRGSDILIVDTGCGARTPEERKKDSSRLERKLSEIVSLSVRVRGYLS